MNLVRRRRFAPVTFAVAGLFAAVACGPGTPVAGRAGAASSTTATTTVPVTTETVDEPPPGGSLEDLNDSVPQASGAFQDSQLDSGLTPEYATSYLEAVVRDADRVWVAYFASIPGLTEPFVSYNIVQAGQTYTSTCGMTITTDHPNAYYCPTDVDGQFAGAVWLPLETFMKMWNGDIFGQQSAQTGDFAAAAVVAHEFGHHIQNELETQLNLPPIKGADGSKIAEKELIADCFSGVWAYSAYESGYLEGTDVEEAVAGLNAIGDAQPGGADPHGTPAQRSEAFLLGYNNGTPANCINSYWPGVTA
jgi:predicted metalloprotease